MKSVTLDLPDDIVQGIRDLRVVASYYGREDLQEGDRIYREALRRGITSLGYLLHGYRGFLPPYPEELSPKAIVSGRKRLPEARSRPERSTTAAY